MSLFSDLYNTITKFFKAQEENEDASKSVATNRLKLVLMQDRTNLTPRILEQMRSELIELLSRYVELDKELLDLNFEQEGEQVALMLSIPVIRAKDEEEIDAAIKAREEMLKAISENNDINDAEISDGNDNLNSSEQNNIQSEEDTIELKKDDSIVQELNNASDVATKKKKISNPENMNNHFKSDSMETTDKIESSAEV